MDRKHRIDVRRAGNKLRKLGKVEFTTAGHASFPQDFAEFVRLHNNRWASLEPRLQRFHAEAAAKFLAAGNLRLSLLWLDGIALAATYCFTAGETLYCYLSGFDAAKAQLSPGAVLLGWVIDQAAAEGVQRVDFLRKTERYKYLWGAVDRNNYQVRLTSGRKLHRRPYLE
jgi:CelD/BcsL family acetyltransferase involved in cellulose biosynthesis